MGWPLYFEGITSFRCRRRCACIACRLGMEIKHPGPISFAVNYFCVVTFSPFVTVEFSEVLDVRMLSRCFPDGSGGILQSKPRRGALQTCSED